MKNQLNNRFQKSQTVAEVLKAKGRNFTTGFLDEFDREAIKAAAAISHIRQLAPAKFQPKHKQSFGKPVNNPNANRNNFTMIG